MKHLVLLLLLLVAQPPAVGRDWSGFRGDGSSISDVPAPTEWSVEEGKNIAWQAELPGRGVSGPIVVAGRVFVTASDGPNRERLHTLAFDAATGKRLWSRQVWATGRSNCHETSAIAAPTPASDGERVFAFFSSNDLVSFDLDGRVQWARGLTLTHPRVGNDIGMASSPVVSGPAVVVQAECQGDSFAAAIDRRTGETLWEVERPKESNWASPLAWQSADGKPAVWLQDRNGASLHDAQTGDQLARIDAGCPSVASPSAAGQETLLLATGGVSAFRGSFDSALVAVEKLKPGSPSPVAVGDQVLVINRSGVLACGDLNTGEMLWRRRIGGRYWATPVVAGQHAYCVNDKGEATVLDLANSGAVAAKIDFGEGILGSPAVSDGALYFRSHAHLWKIASPQQAAAPRSVRR